MFRLLQGAAGALLVPGSLSIITASFEGETRARAFGVWAAATSALTVLGPLVGGLIVQLLSWRIAFLVNVPLVLLALYATIRHVPESRDETASRHIDWLGAGGRGAGRRGHQLRAHPRPGAALERRAGVLGAGHRAGGRGRCSRS